VLKRRIIPTLLLDGERLVKGVRFESLRDVGDPVMTARVYDAQYSDELFFLNISPSRENWQKVLKILAKTAAECFMPLGMGRGITSLSDIREVLKHGGDKVCINTAAVNNPDLVRNASKEFGSQCIIVSIDYMTDEKCRREVMIQGGRKATGLDPLEFACRMEEIGAGELLLTAIDRDGTRQGYDIEFLKTVVKKVGIPVIARGGVGTLQHFAEGFREADVAAVAAGSIFHFTDQSPIKTRTWLRQVGIDVRIPQ
jgi:imidazole glycerol-phosphate synthase subunit HisF